MAMSPLQLGLIGAGIVLVVGVIIYNWWQERRVRQRIESAFRPSETQKPTPGPDTARVEPSLRSAGDADDAYATPPAPVTDIPPAMRQVDPTFCSGLSNWPT